nr:MAG TPA: hypothetical protein [Caudoviricetes sp.]
MFSFFISFYLFSFFRQKKTVYIKSRLFSSSNL